VIHLIYLIYLIALLVFQHFGAAAHVHFGRE